MSGRKNKERTAMALGEKFQSEAFFYTDDKTGAKLVRLTSGRYNSSHIYFTNNSLYDNYSKLVIISDRSGTPNYYSVDLNTYEITQVSDLPFVPFPDSRRLYEGIVDGKRNYLYFFLDDDLCRIDLMTYEMISVYKKPSDYEHHVVSCCDDSDYVYTSIYCKAQCPTRIDEQTTPYAPKPHSQIIKAKYDGSGYKVILEDMNWIAHVNVSPTDQHKITFCHEGTWHCVDNRIWGMDTESGKVWAIKDPDGATVGHEFWYSDGKRIGYHGHLSGKRLFASCNFDGTPIQSTSFEGNTGQTFALDEKLIVGDGSAQGKYLRLWRLEGESYGAPRALCLHNCTFKTQSCHVHPRFFHDGKRVLFTSDKDGYEQVYIVDIGDFDSLPLLETLSKL